MLFRREIIQNYGVLPGEGAVFCPGLADFRWRIAQKCYAFSARNYIKLRSAAGGGGGFLPWVGRFLSGDSIKVPYFFGAELYKITECCRGRGRFFVLGGQVFAGG